eukprot:CAMPEP_0174351506 /NCGR_PEP_ID=MMETSP0811_2-20130205/8900_1 /TAXON_ID=73025 ORGANISM="Eutreptiella gymnastica-like, Strain CCMP1594" /NCGR_SAMPLE_ID=MMETSP0811_2 /ASSEMBLY_ACC=CAM_ASM_000667 /LENGTH=62 /DNA_ID=CAMNT_0015480809 /DNA_START=55 /DNA_END=240 /DNA_ORIENTATION=-
MTVKWFGPDLLREPGVEATPLRTSGISPGNSRSTSGFPKQLVAPKVPKPAPERGKQPTAKPA